MAQIPENEIIGPVVRHMAGQALAMAAVADLIPQLNASIYEAGARTAMTVINFAQGVKDGVEGIGPEVLDVHRQIAEKAQEAILNAYQESLLGTPVYRTDPKHEKNRRYAGGVLRAAIASGGFCEYDERGVYIGNTAILDAAARQWGRLNYGAGAAAGGGAEIFVVRWSDLDAFVLEEPGGARPGFSLPAGRWIGQEFYPNSELSDMAPGRPGRSTYGRSAATPTRGIKGQHWLAAGLRVVANEIGDDYTAVYHKLWAEGDDRAREALGGMRGKGFPKSTFS